MAIKLKLTLPSIIKSDQIAYVYGRFIGESTQLISDIMEVTRSLDLEGYLLTMDIQKAFDSVLHEFLSLVLENAGFGPNFISWMKLILLNQKSSVELNQQVISIWVRVAGKLTLFLHIFL